MASGEGVVAACSGLAALRSESGVPGNSGSVVGSTVLRLFGSILIAEYRTCGCSGTYFVRHVGTDEHPPRWPIGSGSWLTSIAVSQIAWCTRPYLLQQRMELLSEAGKR
jgi:hypothetical protein